MLPSGLGDPKAWKGLEMSAPLRARLSAKQKDELIVRLTRQGWSTRQVGRYLGMSHQGVAQALHRIRAGRPARDDRG